MDTGERTEHVAKSGPNWGVGLLVAILVVVGLGVTAIVGWRTLVDGADGDDPAAAIDDGGSAAETAARTGQPTEMIIWLDVGVSETQVAAIDGLLAEHPAVVGHRYVDLAETFADFQSFYDDEPEIQDLVQPEQLPTSFTADIKNVSEDGFIAELEAVAGVDEVETASEPQERQHRVTGQARQVVWLDVDVTAARVEMVDQALAAHPLVIAHRYVDAEETYADFLDFYVDEPEIQDLVDPDQLPTAFEITLELGPDPNDGALLRETFISEIELMAGVDEVESLFADDLDGAVPEFLENPND